jgi:hypothetical protein
MFFPSFLSGGLKRITVSRRMTEAGQRVRPTGLGCFSVPAIGIKTTE